MVKKFESRPHPHLYEINTAAWLFELSQKLGKPILLRDVPGTEWDRLKELGMDYVWLMGVWTRSQEGRKISLNDPAFHTLFEEALPYCSLDDILGSCYSISSYGPDPLIGEWDDLTLAHRELNRRGMGLILDFVPNHTGIDHYWLSENPEYYIQGTQENYSTETGTYFPVKFEGKTLYIAHGRDPNFPPWTDTAQLNYFNPDTRAAMISRLKAIGEYCDGVRCDMAMLVLNDIFERIWGEFLKEGGYDTPEHEFWSEAFAAVPDLVYIAEAYWDTEYRLQQLGFDFVYDKTFYDRLKSGRPHDLYLHLTAGIDYQSKLMRFVENHDELRSVIAFGKAKIPAAAALFSTLPGLKLFFHGQLEGKQIRLPIQIRQAKPEIVDLEIQDYYKKLLPLLNQDVMHRGKWQLKDVFKDVDETNENLIAYTWKYADILRLIIVNLNQHPASGRICLYDDTDETRRYSLTDLLSGQTAVQDGKIMAHPGLSLKLSGYQAQIWEVESVAR